MANQTKPLPRRAKRPSNVNWRLARLLEAQQPELDEARDMLPSQLMRRVSLRPIARLQDE